jgi:DNA-binding MarR family transcriptional regulator
VTSTSSRKRTARARSTPWLTPDQEAAWRALAAVTVYLPWALECQLQRDAGLSFVEYHVLAMLSEQPDHNLRMSELAAVTHASLSRLSHLVKRLEARGFVYREPDPTDGRYTLAILTDVGHAHLVESAPAHVEAVRQFVIDALSPDQLHSVHEAAQRILERIQPSC